MIAGAVSHVRHNVPAYVALVIALLAGAGLAKAAIPDANNVIHACYDNAGRTIQVIDTEAGAVCAAGQTALNWNQTGPPGPAGPPGPPAQPAAQGPAGPSFERAQVRRILNQRVKKPSRKLVERLVAAPVVAGEVRSVFRDEYVGVPQFEGTTVASLVLPPGRWVIHAKTVSTYSIPSDYPFAQSPTVFCGLKAGVDSDTALTVQGTIAAHVVHHFSKPGVAVLTCVAAPVGRTVRNTKITAMRVSKLTNKPFGGQ